MILALVLFFGISLTTMYASGLVELDQPVGGDEQAMNEQVIDVQQAFHAAGRELADNPDTGAVSESVYAANYPSVYAGHGGEVTVIADGQTLTVYSNDPAIPGAVEALGFATHCSSLAGLSTEVGGDPRLAPACESNTDGELPAGVPPGRLVIHGAF